MAASYPTSVKSFTTKTNKVDDYDASHINDLQDEVSAIQTELGTDPAGSVADLKTRLAVSLSNSGGVAGGSSFPVSPTADQLFTRTDEDTLYRRNSGNTAWISIGALSNVIAHWRGEDAFSASTTDGHGFYSGASSTPAVTSAVNNFYIRRGDNGQSFSNVIPSFKWTKTGGVTSVACILRAWADSAHNFSMQVVIGSASNSLAVSATQNTPSWRTAFSVDVSGLVDGTTYDVDIELRADTGSGAFTQYCSGYMLLGE